MTDGAAEPEPAPTAGAVADRRVGGPWRRDVVRRLGGLLQRAGAAGTGPGWAVAGGGVTFAWVVVALAGGDGSPVDTTAAGAAAAAGTAALVAASWRPRVPQRAAVAFAVLVLFPVTMAAASAGQTAPLAAALVVFAAVEYTLPAVAGGSALLFASLVAARLSAGGWVLPGDGGAELVLALTGSAVLVVGAATGPHRLRPLVAPAVLLGTAAAAFTTADAVPVLAAALAVAAAALAGDRPSVALAALAVGAAAVPVAPAWGLLAAASVLALAVPGPTAALLGVPGAAALAAAEVPPGGGFAGAALMAGAAGVAFALARRPGQRLFAPAGDAAATPALVLGAWLVLAPGTWRWAGGGGLGPYDRGMAVAAAVAFLALLGTGLAALGGVPLDAVVEPPPPTGRPTPLRRAHARRRWQRRPSTRLSAAAARHRRGSSQRRRGRPATPAPERAEPVAAPPPPSNDRAPEPDRDHPEPAPEPAPEARPDDETGEDVGPVVVVRPAAGRRPPPSRGGSPGRR